ncbi:unnamed protein product [Musa acuminata subsp. malaccensis]|uniref:(wild Malaysian banana) hypothetical protein n=1 Tax=Musa acuminata subsp. malaccensis TaxID=214687 RepID=A0A804L0Y4_MUSAM|nr:PREDICTED: putative GATA transcription factor 22 isoform X1 [Musa acuminata subsp. malaccensis]CAG1854762.1 unnamed protein product [Musa acuminata subsp. malaccensis]
MVPLRTVEQICFPVLLCPLVSFQVIDTLFREGLQRPYSYPLSPSYLSMSPFSLNQSPTVPVEEGERDPGQASSFSCPSFFGSRHDPRAYLCMDRQEPKERFLPHPVDSKDDGTLKLSLCDPYVTEEGVVADRAGQWMSSKMRFMRKMMNSSHIVVSKQPRGSMRITPDDQSRSHRLGYSGSNRSNNSPSGIIRVCSDCNTTKTPLWRSGPRGPKSLCNACGIRQSKARRAMAAAAPNGGLIIPATSPAKAPRQEKIDIDRTLPFKKRCKIDTASSSSSSSSSSTTTTTTASSSRKHCFGNVTSSSNKSSAIQRVFPQEERDAAILLMGLSCGLIRS